MYKTEVEIYSDQSNSAVLRHPGRNYPGVLIQGDSLNSLRQDLLEAIDELSNSEQKSALDILTAIEERIGDHLDNYKSVLNDHDIDLPFTE